jgi:5-formyltetrahydrofolate cyclo-ligase
MLSIEHKVILRKGAIEARKALRGDDRRKATRAATGRAFRRLASTEGVIGLYEPFRDEIHPGELIRRLAEQGRRLALPSTPAFTAPIVFRAWAPGDPLLRGPMDIPEPPPEAPEVFPEVLVVPPVAFDRRCYRIGYGAGFYDRTIPVLRHMHPVFTLGFAFACQEVAAVPDEQHDVPLDAIATDAELIVPGPR